MKLTALIENRGPEHLTCQHGLSIWIRYRRSNLLLDSGSSAAFARNARSLGLDLADVDAAFLSHGHYDHAGGFDAFLAQNDHAPLYLRNDADGAHYADHGEKGLEYIGMPQGLAERHPDRLRFVTGVVQPLDGVWLLPDGTADLRARSLRAGMYQKVGDTYLPEDFSHEQTLVLEGEQGLVAFNSCSHAGAADIISTVLRTFPGRHLSAFVGGFHMMGRGGAETLGWTEEAVLEEGERLKALPVDRYYTCHCTGMPAFLLLRTVLGERISYLQTGDSIEIP